ncbi:MAG: cation transporter [Alphaproteobacteria bacterium]|nr:cation transporter [Alphaproteobacteria bacterium]
MAEHHDHCCPPPPVPDGDTQARRVLWTVLALNAAMFVIELGAGLGAGSVSLQADAVDFLGDSASYAISLFVLGRAPRWRTASAGLKGLAMAGFGLWVIGATVWSLLSRGVPDPVVMGSVGALALVVNVFCAVLLFRFRGGDANMRSVWLCSRNDAIGNIAVMAAASGVFATGTAWPDLAVAAVMASLALYASVLVLAHVAREWRDGAGDVAAPPRRP